jgi:Transposase DDE domain
MNSDSSSNPADQRNKSFELLEEKCRGITLRKLPDSVAPISSPFGKPEVIRIAIDPPEVDALLAPKREAKCAICSQSVNANERVAASLEMSVRSLLVIQSVWVHRACFDRCEDKRIEPHIPLWDRSERTDGTFGRSDFRFDAANNRYICPAGKYLKPSWRMKKKDPYRYRASQYDCQACPLKSKCCPNMLIRKIDRSPFEPARDVARALAKTTAYQRSRKDRKKVEMLFAHLKRILNLRRLRLRGPSGAHDEFLLAAIAQNLRRMAKRLCPPVPIPAFGGT